MAVAAHLQQPCKLLGGFEEERALTAQVFSKAPVMAAKTTEKKDSTSVRSLLESLSQLFAATWYFRLLVVRLLVVSLCLGLMSLFGEMRACAHSRRQELFRMDMSWWRRPGEPEGDSAVRGVVECSVAGGDCGWA